MFIRYFLILLLAMHVCCRVEAAGALGVFASPSDENAGENQRLLVNQIAEMVAIKNLRPPSDIVKTIAFFFKNSLFSEDRESFDYFFISRIDSDRHYRSLSQEERIALKTAAFYIFLKQASGLMSLDDMRRASSGFTWAYLQRTVAQKVDPEGALRHGQPGALCKKLIEQAKLVLATKAP